MPHDRPAIPADIERDLMIEAGYRCAMPMCRERASLVIDHIEDYAKVKKHEFHNLIVLCANCHGLKGTGPRRPDVKALKRIKANLGLINGRYNDTERRVLEHYVRNPDAGMIMLLGMDVLYMYLVEDGLIAEVEDTDIGMLSNDHRFDDIIFVRGYDLTEKGRELVARLRENRDIDPER